MDKSTEFGNLIYETITSLIVFAYMDEMQRDSVLRLCRRLSWAIADPRHRTAETEYYYTTAQVMAGLLARGGSKQLQELTENLHRLDSSYERYLNENKGSVEQYHSYSKNLLLLMGNLGTLNEVGEKAVHQLWEQLLTALQQRVQ